MLTTLRKLKEEEVTLPKIKCRESLDRISVRRHHHSVDYKYFKYDNATYVSLIVEHSPTLRLYVQILMPSLCLNP